MHLVLAVLAANISVATVLLNFIEVLTPYRAIFYQRLQI